MTIKALLYCTKSEPALYKNPTWQLGEWYRRHDPEFLTGDKKNLRNIKILNGTVCFSCDIKEVEEIVKQDKGHVSTNETLFNTKSIDSFTLRQRSCLTGEEMANYSPKHALYLTNVKAIKPFEIGSDDLVVGGKTEEHAGRSFFSYENVLRKAPQNMCWAWAWNDEERKWERVLVLSLRPRHLCNIANGLKDIETRRVVVKEIKEMEK